MNAGLPPEPVYPRAIDDNYTLLLVHNTAESAIAANNEAWGEEIEITPVAADKDDVWADNGFANISGELFYYDSVEKNDNDKVYKLLRCARSLGGAPSRFNAAGTMVRGFVVAEHHNMMVEAIVKTEQFIGYANTPDETTLDWRIRNLRSVPIIFDDFGCPDVDFTFRTVSEDPSEGTLVSYKIAISGNYSSFNLSFGDGSSTNSVADGEHRYAPNALIDPVVTFANAQCTVVQTPIERTDSNQPEAATNQQNFVVATLPDFSLGNINITPFVSPEIDITIPPNLFPCIDLGPLGISANQIPSIIMIEPPLNVPSFIEFGPVDVPSFIAFEDIIFPNISLDINVSNISAISINGIINICNISFPNVDFNPVTFPNVDFNPVTFPNASFNPVTFPNANFNPVTFPTVEFGESGVPETIYFDESGVPETIYFGESDVPENIYLVHDLPSNVYLVCDCDIPSVISVYFGTPPSLPINWSGAPTLNVNWGTPPTINVQITCPSSSGMAMNNAAANAAAMRAFEDFNALDDTSGNIEVAYDVTGFPSEIRFGAPPEMKDINIVHDLPNEIWIRTPDIPLIKWDTPPELRIKVPDEPLTFRAEGIPDVLKLVVDENFPRELRVAMPISMPVISIDASGIPDVIRVDMPRSISVEPITFKVEAPEFIPISYVGGPIPVSVEPISVAIHFDMKKLLDENSDDVQCFALVPCGSRQ